MKISSTYSRRAISTAATVAVIVVILAIAGIAAYFVFTPSSTPSSSSTTKTTSKTTTSSTTSTTSTSKSTTPVQNQPQFVKDNTLVLEGAANYQYLDPQVSYYSYDYGVIQNQYETLLWWNGTNQVQPIPWLASSYTQVSPLEYQVNLRQGINFQDGTPFNATAVCFTFNRLLVQDAYQPVGYPSGSGWIIQQLVDPNGNLFTPLGGDGAAMHHSAAWVSQVLALNFCQIINNYEVQFNLQALQAPFNLLIAGTWASIVSPSFVISHDFPHAGTNLTQYYVDTAGNGTSYLDNSYQGSLAGTGPYEITSVNPTTYEIQLQSNPNYWGGPPGYEFGTIHPTIAKIDLQVVTDQATRTLALKGGQAAGVGVSPDSIFSLLSYSDYQNSGTYVSDTPNVAFYGPYPYFNTGWIQFNLNVTNSAGQVLPFQPFADQRFRLAVQEATNVTADLAATTYGLSQYANDMIPPGTLPVGSYNASITAPQFNLTNVIALLQSACATPRTNFVDVNGTPYASGTINNACNGQVVDLYYQAGDTITEKILTDAASNLNVIAIDNLTAYESSPLTFVPVPVPAGTLYTLAGEHQIYAYWAGWLDDYNWAVDWTAPMFASTGTYPLWSEYNFTSWNNLVALTIANGNGSNNAALVQYTNQLMQLSNNQGYYWLHEYQLYYVFLSTWVHGWFWNNEYSPNADYWAVMSFGPPSSS